MCSNDGSICTFLRLQGCPQWSPALCLHFHGTKTPARNITYRLPPTPLSIEGTLQAGSLTFSALPQSLHLYPRASPVPGYKCLEMMGWGQKRTLLTYHDFQSIFDVHSPDQEHVASEAMWLAGGIAAYKEAVSGVEDLKKCSASETSKVTTVILLSEWAKSQPSPRRKCGQQARLS